VPAGWLVTVIAMSFRPLGLSAHLTWGREQA